MSPSEERRYHIHKHFLEPDDDSSPLEHYGDLSVRDDLGDADDDAIDPSYSFLPGKYSFSAINASIYRFGDYYRGPIDGRVLSISLSVIEIGKTTLM